MFRLALLFVASIPTLLAQVSSPTAPAPTKELLQIPAPGRFKELFSPFRTDNAAISPDGKYLAYSLREGEAVFIRIVAIDHPATLVTQAQVIDDDGATPMLAMSRTEKTPGRITWLGWATPTRVVVATNRLLSRPSPSGEWYGWVGSVVGFNVDGGKAKVLASPDDTDEFAADDGPSRRTVPGARSGGGGVGRAVFWPDLPKDERPKELPTGEIGLPPPVPDDRIAAQPSHGPRQTRTLRVLGFDPDRAGCLLLRAVSPTIVATYSLNAETGKLKALSDEPILEDEDVLIDQQGRLRVTVPNRIRGGFPLRYEYRGSKGTSKGQPLDQATGLTGFSLSPENYFAERAVPLGFDYDPNLLYYASNIGLATFGLYSVDLATRQRGRLAMQNPDFDLIGPPTAGFSASDALVFDRFQRRLAGVRFEGTFSSTAWINPAWQELQAGFEKTFPGLGVKIADWDRTGNRLVVTTEGPADPGAIYVYDTGKQKLLEFVRRAPQIDASLVQRTLPFSIKGPDGTAVSGLLTVPRQSRLKLVPMVVLCPDLPWQRVSSNFQAEVQALAGMGFVVVQLNGRGVWGFGLPQRQALAGGYDLVQVEDIVTAVGYLAKTFPVSADRVALAGRGHGGFIALRALQAHPDKFRCAIALDAPVNPGTWLAEQRWDGREAQPQLTRAWFGDATRLAADPLAGRPEAMTKPILMLNYPGPNDGLRRSTYAAAQQFATKVRACGTEAEFGDLTTDYMNGLPVARATVFDRIEAFLNTHVYDFSVKVHETEMEK